MRVVEGQLSDPEVIALLEEHLQSMADHSPPQSVHALDIEGLSAPDVTFWSFWDDGSLLGCGALRQLGATEGEIKSMRTATAHLRKGVGAAILQHIIDEARRRGYLRLNLETGSGPAFAAALELYRKFGFTDCGPFATYREDPFSRFMTLALGPR